MFACNPIGFHSGLLSVWVERSFTLAEDFGDTAWIKPIDCSDFPDRVNLSNLKELATVLVQAATSEAAVRATGGR
jgi:hypothetical protein